MDITAILAQIGELSVEDRIRLVQVVWESIPVEARVSELTDAQKAELGSRLAELQANPEIGLTWEQIRQRIKPRYTLDELLRDVTDDQLHPEMWD
jgi:putative addiction module component (TIGR02574 family)